MQPRNQQFDRALALMPRRVEHIPMVLGREMRLQQSHRRQMNRTVGEPLENQRESPRRACCLNPVVRRVL